MPIFEFECSNCDREFEELLFNTGAVSEVICPECGSSKVNKKISTFASKAAGGSSFSLSNSAATSCTTGST
ncbi:MAG: zinc ribbon domain-containing protein [Anaerolineales bacterium]